MEKYWLQMPFQLCWCQIQKRIIGVEANIDQNEVKVEVIQKVKIELVDKINLMGMQDGSLEETWDLILEYMSIFAMHDVDLGKMSLVKHSIKRMDNIPFKMWYRCIP